ncbi:MAG TPA: hypothetical protein VFP93_01410, partial [Gammaproteobacteria bacterium]|nr:hypothetical protein [Gammaproteobacteria bacterium]
MTFSEILEKLHKILKLNSYGNNDACDQAQQLVNELKNSVNSDIYSLITPIIEKSQDSNFAIEIPESAQNFSNYFDPSVYQELLNYTTLAHYFEPNGIPEEQALKLSVLFGDCEAALKYISNNKSSLHDACLFQLPPVEECNFSLWQQHAKKSMLDYRFRKLLPNANEIEKLMFSAKKQKLDYQAINAKKNEINHVHREWKNLKRKHGTLNNAEKGRYQQLGKDLFQLNEELVPLCSGISLHNADLVILNAFYQHYIKTAHPSYQYFLQHGLTSKDYDKFVALNREQAGKNIPDLIIDGTEIGYPGFYLM